MKKLVLPKGHPHEHGRVCVKCSTYKSVENYRLSRGRTEGNIQIRSDCNSCLEHRKYKAFIKKTYGITYDTYEEILKEQDHKCAICKCEVSNKRVKKFSVDHDHKTGKVRGLLCSKCNSGLGHFNDSQESLLEAIKYLNRAESNELS